MEGGLDMDKADILEEFGFYREAAPPVRASIARAGAYAALPAGTTFYREGESCGYLAVVGREQLRIVSKRRPTEQEIRDMLFAWKVVKYVKSNAIVYVRDQRTIGIGAGQMSRVYSARIAAIKAADEGLPVPGSVMASDAFFPFRDGIDAAAAAGVTAVIEPGGSLRDEEVIAAANEHDMAMVFTGIRHFRH